MKLNVNNKTVTPSIDTVAHPTYKAQIDKSAAGLVMDILAKLYTNPLAAAIREYTSNAIDAHIASGSDKPVEVNLPSKQNQWLTIRDYGKGLTAFDILTVYANFGSSDKRDSDKFIGGFGIGSKSGLAISDAIYVNSWTNGKLNSFVIKRTVDGIVTQFLKENVDAPYNETGTEVKVFVKENYLITNYKKSWKNDMYMPLAGWSFRQVKVQHDDPDIAKFINENRIPDSWHEFKHGFVNENAEGMPFKHGIMVGNVYYNTDDEMRDIYNKVSVFDCKDGLMQQPFVLKLDIADTKVSYSREKILWKDSDDTLNAIARAMKGLVDDIKTAVNSIKAYGLDADNYIRRLSALKLNISTTAAPSAYKSLLLKTPQFDISRPIKIDNVRIEFYRNWKNTLRTSGTRLLNDMNMSKNAQYYIVVNDTVPFDNKMETVRPVIQSIFRLEDSIISSSPSLKPIYDFIHDENNRNPEFIIVHANDFSKIPSIYRQQYDELETLRQAKCAAVRQAANNASAKGQVVVPRSQRVYTMRVYRTASPALELLEQNVSYEEQRKTLLLPHNSKYAFAVMNVPIAPRIIIDILPFNKILCAKTNIDFERMKTAQPNAIVMNDNEISAAIASHLHEREWASKDTFCQAIFNELNSLVLAIDDKRDKYDKDWQPVLRMNIRQNNEDWRNIYYVPRIMESIEENKSSEVAFQDIQKLMDTMPADPHPHQRTSDLRLLLSLCHARHTYMYRHELDTLVDKVKTQYAYEIAHIQHLYR